jgi:DNA-binding LytR/AlgR family response regulator
MGSGAAGGVAAAISDVRNGAYARQVVAAFAGLKQNGLVSPPAGTDRIAIPVDDRLTVVRVAEIDWVEALGNYVSLHVARRSHLLRETVSAMEQRLSAHGFVRIHRSTIVNVQRVSVVRE